MRAIKSLEKVPPQAKEIELDATDPQMLSDMEFLLEKLYVNNRLSKYNKQGKTFFRR